MTISYHIEHRNDVYDKRTMYKFLNAFVIGDGGLWVGRDAKNAVYYTSRLWNHLDFVLWQSVVLSQITKVYILQIPAKGIHKISLRMKTMSHPFYTVLWERLYGTGRKALTFHDLQDFDAESLSVLVQDDGSFDHKGHRAYICTDSFSEPECKLLRDTIAEKTNIHADLIRYKNYYRLRFNTRQTYKLIDEVQPFFAPSYYYKLNQTPSLETVASWYAKYQDDGIVRTLLKDSELYREVIA